MRYISKNAKFLSTVCIVATFECYRQQQKSYILLKAYEGEKLEEMIFLDYLSKQNYVE